jgi:ammonium transporter, Amt family
VFTEQVSTSNLLVAFIYVVGTVSVLFVVAGLGFIDMGMVRSRNVLTIWAQKMTAAMVCGLGTLLFGYAIWQWQFYVAFDVPNPFVQAFKDWWIGGANAGTAAIMLDPKAVPEADTQQVFLVFFVTFSMATAALIHSSAIERIRSTPLYVMSFVIGLILSPIVGYLCWGPLSPLTNNGLHDFEGVFPLYIFSGTWALVLAWRLKPRLGALTPHPCGVRPTPSNHAFVAVGVLLIFFAIPFIAIGSTWIVPDHGVYGISITRSGIGRILINVFCAVLSAGVVGSLIAAKRQEVSWVFLGPVTGAVICGTLFDIGRPLECLLLGALGPLVALGTGWLVRCMGIDEPKVVPLALGPGIVGTILVGFLYWGTPTGGFPGMVGRYALGHAQISPWWQLTGVVVTVLVSGIPAFVLCLIYEKSGGLRVTPETEIDGLDRTFWGAANNGDDLNSHGAKS